MSLLTRICWALCRPSPLHCSVCPSTLSAHAWMSHPRTWERYRHALLLNWTALFSVETQLRW